MARAGHLPSMHAWQNLLTYYQFTTKNALLYQTALYRIIQALIFVNQCVNQKNTKK